MRPTVTTKVSTVSPQCHCRRTCHTYASLDMRSVLISFLIIEDTIFELELDETKTMGLLPSLKIGVNSRGVQERSQPPNESQPAKVGRPQWQKITLQIFFVKSVPVYTVTVTVALILCIQSLSRCHCVHSHRSRCHGAHTHTHSHGSSTAVAS